MGNSLRDIIKKRFYTMTRDRVKKELTGNLGPVVEDDEKLTCYVEIERCKHTDNNFSISCYGIGKSNKELAEIHNLNKPIVYVLDGLNFEKNKVQIMGYDNCTVVIKNCRFNLDLYVCLYGKFILEDSFIRPFNKLLLNANEMVINNMNIGNELSVIGNNLSIIITAEKRLDIINSGIGKEKEKIAIWLKSKNELNLVNSQVVSDEINCESKTLSFDNDSSLKASNKVNITTGNFKKITITSPLVVCNGSTYIGTDEPLILEKVLDSLRLKQLALVNVLKNLKDKCEKSNLEEIDQYKTELDNLSVSRILKK